MRRRLHQWGFNTAGAWSLPPAEIGLPSTPELELGRSVQFVWTDPFDPAIEPVVRRAAVEAVAPYRGNPLRIGYFSDNEIGWWNGPVFMAFLGYPPENHTKRRLVALLQAHYGSDWRAFCRDFVPAPQTASFDDLLATRIGAASAARRRRHRGDPRVGRGTGGAVLQRHARRVARRRSRGALSRRPAADLLRPRRGARHGAVVDAISVNYNVDAADGWIAPYFFAGLRDLSGGKPVLITEWFYAAAENRSGNLNRTGAPRADAQQRISNNRNRTGHLMTVATQEERARGAGRAARLLAAVPNAIGVHWFQYTDEPPGGRADGEDYDFGLVDVDDRPYEGLVAALRDSNRMARQEAGPDRRAAATAARGETVLPRADIDAASENLADWPKAASLLPMHAGPSEVPFGDVHLAWDERGLFLATISMDYYAPELLGPLRQFPRSEAFRIALAVDAGGGPQRVELRVVPQEVVHTGLQETKLSFGAQVCRWQAGDGCAAVPGASAHYFGTALDQPRVILKAFVPWAQLGLAEPRRGDACAVIARGDRVLSLEMDVDRRRQARCRDGAPGDVAGGPAGRRRRAGLAQPVVPRARLRNAPIELAQQVGKSGLRFRARHVVEQDRRADPRHRLMSRRAIGSRRNRTRASAR